MASVQLTGLTKFYGKRRGVENVSLDIPDQEFLTVFRPAGAGKTTTPKLIAGIVTPNQGAVQIGNRVVDSLEPADRNVAMVFESYALYPQLTVYQNMAFPLKSPKHRLRTEEIERRVRHFARMLKIDHLLNRPIQALSNGQRQRTALGRALVRNPQVFLLDEPLSHLDAKLRHSMRAELKEMRQQLGTTTIYVTHDYLEAMSLGDRIVILNEGRIQQIGTPDDVYFFPAHTDVAKLFGDPEINLIEASIRNRDALTLQMLGENISVTIPDQVASTIRQSGREKVLVGFPPAGGETRDDINRKDNFPAVIYSFEPLGTKSILSLDAADGTRVRSLVDGRERFEIDRRTQFFIHPDHMIFFDPLTHGLIGRAAAGTEVQ